MALEDWLKDQPTRRGRANPRHARGAAGSAHAANRICSNDLLSKSVSGEYPVG